MYIHTAPDLTLDFQSAVFGAEGDLSVPSPGRNLFWLSGLYSVQASKGLELEFTDIDTLRRVVIYPGGDSGTFLFLPRGEYKLYYRLIGSLTPDEVTLSMQRMGVFKRLGLYAAKGLRLAGRPGRWLTVARHLLTHRMGSAIGISLARSAETPPLSLSPRLAEQSLRPKRRPEVSIIIPTKTRHDLLRACLDSLRLIDGVTFEVIIIDNGATDPAMLALLQDAAMKPHIRVIRQDIPFNFSTLCNRGAAAARYPLLVFLNDDVEALDGSWLYAMAGFAEREDVGVVGARLLYESRDLQHAGVATHLIPGPGHPWRGVPESLWRTHPYLSVAGEVDAVTGACLMIRRDLFDQVGGFDEARFPVSLNDIDLCLKVRRVGLKAIYAPEATLLHKEGQSRRADHRPEEYERRDAELRAFVELYPDFARQSIFYPPDLRRDNDRASPV
ncbi:glycosyltransferase family 2 protein [Asticcacaulis excentricus]|uniref:Glycosyl transferase, family 2 n=1 Tax=Asticcacaulis excentricus TaxID=78587 RepID=A0A3G9G262_9CAUL|nr:glycosyltransferase family 2 protein [Asticcacaulis excentricus]BBF81390.1 glycosyl transferase, family 2 [Asticcacaulis excentricus]